MGNKRMRPIIIIAVSILFFLFGIYDQYRSISTGDSFFGIMKETGQEGEADGILHSVTDIPAGNP